MGAKLTYKLPGCPTSGISKRLDFDKCKLRKHHGKSES